MTEYDYKTHWGFSYLWLIVAIAAIISAFAKGAWHHLFTACIALLMHFVMRPKKWIHIPGEVYADLNEKIQFIISSTEEDHKKTTVESELEDGAIIRLIIEISQRKSETKFRDDAWGATRIFNESHWDCSVDMLDVTIMDKNYKLLDSDFNQERIETEYDTTEWN